MQSGACDSVTNDVDNRNVAGGFVGGYRDTCGNVSTGYGQANAPPCGLNYSTSGSGPCCWDSTLCYPVPEDCAPGENVVSISRASQLPTIGSDAASLLAIYNYSVQRVISRSIKFVTSYYDWLWCQNAWLLNQTSGANSLVEGTAKPVTTTYPVGVGGTTGAVADSSKWSNGYNSSGNLDAQTNPLAQGAGFLPPASLFTQLVQILGWSNFNFDQIDICQCICSNFCQVIQLLVNLDGNSKIRDFIMDSAFSGNGCLSSGSPTYLGCGNLYDEGQLVDYGRKVSSVVDIMIEVLNVLDLKNDSEKAEGFISKFCSCLTQAAAADPCCPLNQSCDGTFTSAQKSVQSELRQQFFAMFVDLLTFLFFDRDCEDFGERDCDSSGCPKPVSVEDWMQARCRAGTGNGKAVVCSGPVCAKYRKKDDYKPLMSVLFAVKYTVELYTVDRSGGSDYARDVENIYNNILASYYNLYNSDDDESDSLVFYPDCAAPQFCCSTILAGGKCVNVCGQCKYVPGCNLYPVPCIDTRLATNCCGNGTAYDPSAGFQSTADGTYTTGRQVGALYQDVGGTWTKVAQGTAGDSAADYYSFCQPNLNPCVVMPAACNVVECNTSCCTTSCTTSGGYSQGSNFYPC